MRIYLDGIIFSLQRHGGISVYFRELIDRLVELGIPTRLSLEIPVLQDLKDVSIPPGALRNRRLLERYRLCRVNDSPSLFHSSYYRRPSDPGIATVVTVHDFIYERFYRGPRRWAHTQQKNSAIKQAQALICPSESTRDDLLEYVGARSDQLVHVIPNGVSRLFKPITIKPSPRPFIMFVGERRGYKNFSFVLAGLSYVPDIYLHCVGGGPLRDDEFVGCTTAVRSRVRHLGFISGEVLNDAYNQAVCLVYPSLYEGFGIPVVEAMRAGCPVVSLNCRAVVEVGGSALERVDGDEPKLLADAVLRLCEPRYRSQRVLAGLKRSEIYDWRRCHDQTLTIYRKILM